jgi:hypothetical protein
MSIDLGNNPSGNRPTIAQKTQMRASIGCSQAPFLIGNTEQLVDNSNSFLKNPESQFAFQVGAVNSLNFQYAGGIPTIVNLNALHDKNTITSINGVEASLLGLDASNCTGIYQPCEFDQCSHLANPNFSGCSNLPYIGFYDNPLTGLNVAECTKLTTLSCTYNNQLTNINLNGCTKLINFYCYNNQLTNLNVAGLTGLTTLNCVYNQLTGLNVSGCTKLINFYCYNNQLTNLNVAGLTGLTTLNCVYNQLTGLNVSGCTNLTSLNCQYNNLTSASVNNILITLSGLGKSSGNAIINGDGIGPPTGLGISAKTYLINTKAWSVSTN